MTKLWEDKVMEKVFEYDDKGEKIRCTLKDVDYTPTALGVHCYGFTIKSNGASFTFDVVSEEDLDRICKHPIPEYMKQLLQNRLCVYVEAVGCREKLLHPLLCKITEDPKAVMTEEYRSSLEYLVELDYCEEDEKLLNTKRTIYEQQVLEIYWKPKIPYNHRRFYSGGYSDGGFMGWGEILENVIEEDAAILKEMGYNCQQVGLKLKEILDDPDVYNNEYKTTIHGWMGSQICPFEGKAYRHSSVDFVITNRKTGGKVSGPGLIWHLISKHGFFEGKKSPYRVDPEQLVKVLFG